MPCESVRTTVLQLGPKTDSLLLRAALERVGGKSVNYSFDNLDGRLELYGSSARLDRNEINRAYSREIVLAQARKMGARVIESEVAGKTQLRLQLRG